MAKITLYILSMFDNDSCDLYYDFMQYILTST